MADVKVQWLLEAFPNDPLDLVSVATIWDGPHEHRIELHSDPIGYEARYEDWLAAKDNIRAEVGRLIAEAYRIGRLPSP
jgi:hypothetical protein